MAWCLVPPKIYTPRNRTILYYYYYLTPPSWGKPPITSSLCYYIYPVSFVLRWSPLTSPRFGNVCGFLIHLWAGNSSNYLQFCNPLFKNSNSPWDLILAQLLVYLIKMPQIHLMSRQASQDWKVTICSWKCDSTGPGHLDEINTYLVQPYWCWNFSYPPFPHERKVKYRAYWEMVTWHRNDGGGGPKIGWRAL